MRIITVKLVSHEVEGWPEEVIKPTVTLGKLYRVDMDSLRLATLKNLDHPEWGQISLFVVTDVDEGFPLPICCLDL